jgi:hypothetical protein
LVIENLKKIIFPYFKDYIDFFVDEAKMVFDDYHKSIISEATNIEILMMCDNKKK